MARLSVETRRKVIALYSRGYSVIEIRRRFLEDGTSISHRALYSLLKKYREKRTVLDLPRRKRERIITEQMKALMEDELNKNDELTSTGIKTLLSQKWPGLQVSLSTIKRVRKNMGWVCTRPHYCQLIREVSYDF